MTIDKIADYIKITVRTVYRLAGAKKVPVFKVGRIWRFARGILLCGYSVRPTKQLGRTEMPQAFDYVQHPLRPAIKSSLKGKERTNSI